MGFIYFILICVLGFFILCAIALISSEADNKKIKKEREAFADDCSSSILRKFSVQISCFYNYGNYSRTDCESPAAKYQLAVNFRLMRAILSIKNFENGVLASVDIYRKSGSGEFEHYCRFSRKEYIDILLANGYTFTGTDENELFSGRYSSQEEKRSTERFLCSASEMPIVRRCENSDFLKEFLD